jgi:hypothetical protein
MSIYITWLLETTKVNHYPLKDEGVYINELLEELLIFSATIMPTFTVKQNWTGHIYKLMSLTRILLILEWWPQIALF